MSIIDTLRFRNILVNGDVAEEEVAQELVTALDETFEDATQELATKSDIQQLRAEMAQTRAEMRAEMAELRAEMREEVRALEVRLTRMMMYVGFGLFAALAALMTLLQVFLD